MRENGDEDAENGDNEKKKKKCEGLKEKEDEANGKWRKGGGRGWK